ncbi:MAG: WxcM-like domain-containing protein [Bacteroidales bacterium]|nr:WxcM-like domain-containing protein [Bacteroidales bacterium]
MEIELFDFDINGECECGFLVSLEEFKNIPFEIKRVYYIYGTNPCLSRGAHAHKESNQILICVHGSCEIFLDDGEMQKKVLLDKPNKGLLQKSMIWGEMHHLTEDCVLMVLADDLYDTDDYIRDYEQFLELAKVSS